MFAVHGRVAAIRDVPRLNIVVRDVDALNDDLLRRIKEAACGSGRETQFRDHYSSRWRALGPISTSPMLTYEVRADLALIRSTVDSVLDTGASASAACGVDAPETQFEATQLLRLLAHLKSLPGTIPPLWLDSGGLERASVITNALRKEAAERQELIAVLLSSLNGVPTELRFRECLDAALSDAAEAPRWERMAGSEWSKDLLADPPTRAAEWRAIAIALDSLLEASIHLQTLLGVEHCLDTRTGAESAVAVSERLLKIGMVPTPWSSAQAVIAIHIEVTAARALRDELVSVDKALAESFGPEIIEQVDDEMLVRYRTDHRSFWRGLSGTFRRDHRAIRGCCRRPGNLSVEAATTAIEQALSVRRLRALWADTAPSVAGLLGAHYSGLDSDWSSIEAALDALSTADRKFPAQEPTFHSILADAQLLARLEDAGAS